LDLIVQKKKKLYDISHVIIRYIQTREAKLYARVYVARHEEHSLAVDRKEDAMCARMKMGLQFNNLIPLFLPIPDSRQYLGQNEVGLPEKRASTYIHGILPTSGSLYSFQVAMSF